MSITKKEIMENGQIIDFTNFCTNTVNQGKDWIVGPLTDHPTKVQENILDPKNKYGWEDDKHILASKQVAIITAKTAFIAHDGKYYGIGTFSTFDKIFSYMILQEEYKAEEKAHMTGFGLSVEYFVSQFNSLENEELETELKKYHIDTPDKVEIFVYPIKGGLDHIKQVMEDAKANGIKYDQIVKTAVK